MRHVFIRLLLAALLAPSATWAAGPVTTQTIVMVRHGEKPAAGLGQLDCQGLNRAMALPTVIARDYGHPTAVFAPNPSQAKADAGVVYDYIRPLATVEPAAIAFGLPVDTNIGFEDIGALQRKLEAPALRNALVLVGWEHYQIFRLAQQMLSAHGGDAKSVPDWKSSDFDSVYVIKLAWTGNTAQASFERHQEGLDGQPKTCPGQSPG